MIKFIYTGLRFIHDTILHDKCLSRYEAQSPHACFVSASVNDMVSMLTANDRGAARPRVRSTARGSTRSVRDRVRLSRLSLLTPPSPPPSTYNNNKPSPLHIQQSPYSSTYNNNPSPPFTTITNPLHIQQPLHIQRQPTPPHTTTTHPSTYRTSLHKHNIDTPPPPSTLSLP